MAPARHETGPPQLDGAEDKTAYGTRASKRKASEMTSGPPAPRLASSPPSKVSARTAAKAKTVAKKPFTATEPEPRQPLAKKRRSSSTIAPELPSSSSSANQLPEDPILEQNSLQSSNRNSSQGNDDEIEPVPGSATSGPEQDAADQPVPDVQFDGLNGSNEDDADADAEGEDEEEVAIPDEDVPEPSNGVPGPTRGRGRGRGRGGRGFRGGSRGRGSRGGRVKAGVGARGAKPVVASTRGRGRGRGGRRKKPENPRIDSFHKRKIELKAQFKALAALQRNALSVLADKSVEMMQNDPSYHETLPEFKSVSKKLKKEYKKNLVQLDVFTEHEVGLAKRTLEYKEYLVEQQYRLQIEEIQEKYEHRIMEHANYVYSKGHAGKDSGGELDDIPFSQGEDGRIVLDSFPPPKKVHGTGMPFMNPGVAVSNVRGTSGDNDYEQHPANWWQAKSKKEKATILRKQAECVAEKERIHRKEMGGRGKKGGRQALFQPGGQQEAAEGGESAELAAEGEEDGEDQPEEEPIPAEGPSRPPTREGSSPEGLDQNVNEDVEDSDALPQEIDEYGVSIPRKKIRRDQPAAYNRIVVDAPVTFEAHEIGLRKTHMVRQPDGSFKKLGRDVDPNPASGKFYFEQRQGRYNAGKNVPEDLDQEIVATHKLHPRLGLPLPGSLNPDRTECEDPYFKGRTDWGAEWKNTNPVMFIHHNSDDTRTISRTSRSEWLYRAERAFGQIPVSEKMAALLAESGDLESRPATPVAPEPPQFIAKDLVEAVEAASEVQKQDEHRAAEEARIQASRPAPPQMYSPAPPQTPMFTSPSASVYSPPSAYQPQHLSFSPPQPMAPPSRQTGYDPVRDRVYVTPYSQPQPQPQPQPRPPPPPPQLPHATYNNGGGNLSDLADAAYHYGGSNTNETYSSMPPPPTYQAPLHPYGAPPMMPQQQQQHPQRMTGMMGAMGPGMGVFGQQSSHPLPYGPPTQQSPRAGGPGSRRAARVLRPAPPASRPPPPPQPQHPQAAPHPQAPQNQHQQPYRGYGPSGSYQ
ncbi:hypothetical protein BKA65DRAFT_195535 [Rhexocercosporidium sp. MPI-PUGE-AT-0058]|nr:hypothetical protein BKA65DRAFT_195535 [Rhexocercosporidium sp. MPI-PUGE-AT-0058]